jgi:hypothetical protein
MARKEINIGVEGNDGTGDSIRESFNKVNQNFNEIYGFLGQGGQIGFVDLADTPNTLDSEENKIPVVSAVAGSNRIVFKEIKGAEGQGINVNFNAEEGSIIIENTSANVVLDNTPELGGTLHGRSSSGFEYGIVGIDTSEKMVNRLNILYNSDYSIQDIVPDKQFIDDNYIEKAQDAMTGALGMRPEPGSQPLDAISNIDGGLITIVNHGYDSTNDGKAVKFIGSATNLDNSSVYYIHTPRYKAFKFSLSNSASLTRGHYVRQQSTGATGVIAQTTSNDAFVYIRNISGTFSVSGGVIDTSSDGSNWVATTLNLLTVYNESAEEIFFEEDVVKLYTSKQGAKIGAAGFVNCSSPVGACYLINANYNDMLQGHYDFDEALPRQSVVRRQGDDMTGLLQLWDHPGELSGDGTPSGFVLFFNTPVTVVEGEDLIQANTGAVATVKTNVTNAQRVDVTGTWSDWTMNELDTVTGTTSGALNAYVINRYAPDLLAATKYYVDKSTPVSKTNLFVSWENGDDNMVNVPTESIGRSFATAFKTVGHAARYAERIIYGDASVTLDDFDRIDMDPARDFVIPYDPVARPGVVAMTGPYRQVITYKGPDYPAKVVIPPQAVVGQTEVYDIQLNHNGTVIDQAGDNTDNADFNNNNIIPGKIITTRTITGRDVRGRILNYTQRANPFTSDIIRYELLTPGINFQSGDEVEYGNSVRDVQITLMIESGQYEEDYPIRMAENVSVSGDHFRRVILRPKDAISKSPWAKTYFRRDRAYDGNVGAKKQYITLNSVVSLDAGDIVIQDLTGARGIVQTSDTSNEFALILCQGEFEIGPDYNLRKYDNYATNSEVETNLNTYIAIIDAVEYGYHYLTDPEDINSTPLNNRDMDVLMMNNATFISGFTCQDHGGFMEVLDPDGQIQTKSPYTQTAASFTRSLGDTQRFAGGIFIDGKVSNLEAYLYDSGASNPQGVGNTSTEVAARVRDVRSGNHKRFPSLPTIIIKNGKRYQVNDIINKNNTTGDCTLIFDSNTPFVNAGIATGIVPNQNTNAKSLLTLNKSFIQAEIIGYINANYSAFSYDQAKCERDTGLILDAVSIDQALGTNYNSVTAGLAYARGNAAYVLSDQLSKTTDAIAYTRDQALAISSVASSSTATTRVTTGFNEVLDILNNGAGNADALSFPVPSSLPTTDADDAAAHLQANRTFIRAEGIAYITQNYPGLTYDSTSCSRDIGYLVDALTHDVLYGGNYATRKAAEAYFVGTTSQLGSGEGPATVATYNHLAGVMGSIVQGNAVTPTTGNSETQDTSNPAATSTEATAIDTLVNIVEGVITAGNLNGLPAEVLPSFTWTGTDLQAARSGIQSARAVLVTNTINYINSNLAFTYNESICYRDVGYIVDALVDDLDNAGYEKSVDAGISYYDNASALKAITQQKTETVAAIQYIATVAGYVLAQQVIGTDVGTKYSAASVTQTLDGSITAEATANSIVSQNISYIIDIINGGADSAPFEASYSLVGDRTTAANNLASQITIETAGNRSILANDFTQVNDLGYGVYVTNNAICELVSVFSYYCHKSYVADNGGEIRSLNGSSIYGNWGLCAIGVDPDEIPDGVRLRDDMIQTAKVSQVTAKGEQSMYIYDYKYVPPQYSILEVRHERALIPKKVLINTAGSGYSAGDVVDITMPGGSAETIPVQIQITAVGPSGEALSASITGGEMASITGWTNDTTPITNLPVSSGSATFDIVFARAVKYYEINSVADTSNAATGADRNETILKLNFGSSGAEGSEQFGLAYAVSTDEVVTIRAIRNFVFNDVAAPTPVKKANAINFNEADIGYNSIDYASNDALGSPVGSNSAQITFQSSYQFIKLLVDNVNSLQTDLAVGTRKYGSKAGDVKIAITESTLSNQDIARLKRGQMIFAWNGELHKINNYFTGDGEDGSDVTGFPYIVINSNDYNNEITASPSIGLSYPVNVVSANEDDRNILYAGLALGERATITRRISNLRSTNHDFADVGTGSYNTTNYPNAIYGEPKPPSYTRETDEQSGGRVFYTSTDQDGNFRVGEFFKIDQGTGEITFNARLALSNVNGLQFSRGVEVKEFSVDEEFTDNAPDAVPTEFAARQYIDKRLGIIHGDDGTASGRLPSNLRIGPGYISLNGTTPLEGDLNFNNTYSCINLSAPQNANDASTKIYTDALIRVSSQLSNLYDVETAAAAEGDTLMFTGVYEVPIDIVQTSGSPTAGATFTASPSGATGAFAEYKGLGSNNPRMRFIPDNVLLLPGFGDVIDIGSGAAQTATKMEQYESAFPITYGTNQTGDVFNDFKFSLRNVDAKLGIAGADYTVGDIVELVGGVISNDPQGQPYPKSKVRIESVDVNGSVLAVSIDENGAYDKPPFPHDYVTVTNVNVANPAATGLVLECLFGGTSYWQIADGVIINSDVNSNADIAQSKLLMTVANTQASAPTGTSRQVQAQLGLSTYDEDMFTLNNGFVQYKTATSTATGLGSEKLTWIATDTVLGRSAAGTGAVGQIGFQTVVDEGNGILHSDIPGTSLGLIERSGVETYSILPIDNGTADATSHIVKTDSSGRINAVAYQISAQTVLERVGLGTAQDPYKLQVRDFDNNVLFIGDNGNMTGVNDLTADNLYVTNGVSNQISLTGSNGKVASVSVDAGNLRLSSNTLTTSTGNLILDSNGGTVNVNDNLYVQGNLTVDGTTTTVNSTTVTIDDPIFVLGGDTAPSTDDNKDRGIMFRWHDGSSAKTGFFGWDDSAQKFVFIKDGTNSSEVMSGSVADVSFADAALASATVSGNFAVNGNTDIGDGSADTLTINASVDSNVIPTGTRNLGSTSNRWSTVYASTVNTPALTTGASSTAGTITGDWSLSAGSKLDATYADLAEKYTADADYDPGTVLVFGGTEEVTTTGTKADHRVAGVVTTNPAYSMNSECPGEHVAEIALQGRVPCKVIGKVEKGDLLVTASKPGYAIAWNNPGRVGVVIGKALEAKGTTEEGVIEVAVGRL